MAPCHREKLQDFRKETDRTNRLMLLINRNDLNHFLVLRKLLTILEEIDLIAFVFVKRIVIYIIGEMHLSEQLSLNNKMFDFA